MVATSTKAATSANMRLRLVGAVAFAAVIVALLFTLLAGTSGAGLQLLPASEELSLGHRPQPPPPPRGA